MTFYSAAFRSRKDSKSSKKPMMEFLVPINRAQDFMSKYNN